jgi:high-affinity iron transporter
VNCCNAEIASDGGWGIFNAILGWENSATYGSVIGYNVYWIAVITAVLAIRYYEVRGHWPLMKASKAQEAEDSEERSGSDSDGNTSDGVLTYGKKPVVEVSSTPAAEIRD